MRAEKHSMSNFSHELDFGRQRPKTINYIPSTVTALNIVLGIAALHVILSTGRLSNILPIILIAAFLDFADGYLARRLNAETRTGCVLDSVADIICFVFVPSLYVFTLHQGHPSISLSLACMFYLLAGVTRLTRYTVSKLRSGGSSFFVGCPVTGAALCAVMATGTHSNAIFHTALLFICSYLMVAGVKYTPISRIFNHHFKDAFFFIYILFVLPFLVFYPVEVIFAFSFAYLIFFPLNLISSRCRLTRGEFRTPSVRTCSGRACSTKAKQALQLQASSRQMCRDWIPIARDAKNLIIVCVLLLLMSALFLPVMLTVIYASILLVFAFFFRDPERTSAEFDESNVLSPADGQIIGIEKIFSEDTKSFFNKVIIFMSIFNVHVNRAPLSLRILKCEHHDGGNLDARHPKAGDNEHNFFTCEFAEGNILLMKQIAGKFARRVVSYAREGDTLNAGERFGMVLFGSRVELFLPEDMEILVKKGDVVRAGKTKVAIRKSR